ncbi:MAG: acyl-CoA thioesterase [Spirochaetales bacterium]|nr:acyl-CoA thioesterase [Spirochaetales bacterium]
MRFFESMVTVRFDETDEMGIVHHKNYFTWFEIIRFNILEYMDIDYYKLRKNKIGFVVINANCNYIKPAKFQNKLLVQTYLKIQKNSLLLFHYYIRRKVDYELLAEGETSHVIVKDNRVLLKIPSEIKEKIELFLKEYEWDKIHSVSSSKKGG